MDEEGFHAEMTKQKERARSERLKKNISGWSADLVRRAGHRPHRLYRLRHPDRHRVVVALSDEETLTDGISHRRPGQGRRPCRPRQGPPSTPRWAARWLTTAS